MFIQIYIYTLIICCYECICIVEIYYNGNNSFLRIKRVLTFS